MMMHPFYTFGTDHVLVNLPNETDKSWGFWPNVLEALFTNMNNFNPSMVTHAQ